MDKKYSPEINKSCGNAVMYAETDVDEQLTHGNSIY